MDITLLIRFISLSTKHTTYIKYKCRSSNYLSSTTAAPANISGAVNVEYQPKEPDVNQHTDEEKVSDDDFDSPEYNANKAESCQEKGETTQGIPMGNIRYGPLFYRL